METIKIYTDGGSLGNPGKGAIGVVIFFNKKIKSYKIALGQTTNNEAEYLAVIYALTKVKKLLGKEGLKKIKVILHLDSELVGNQLLGKYKIKDTSLQKLFIRFWNLKIDFADLEIKIIPREENKVADSLVKEALFSKKLF